MPTGHRCYLLRTDLFGMRRTLNRWAASERAIRGVLPVLGWRSRPLVDGAPDLLALDLVIGGLEPGSAGHPHRRHVIGMDVGHDLANAVVAKPGRERLGCLGAQPLLPGGADDPGHVGVHCWSWLASVACTAPTACLSAQRRTIQLHHTSSGSASRPPGWRSGH